MLAAVSTTAPAARRTRFTAPLLPPSEPPPDEPPDELPEALRLRAPPRDDEPARFDDERFALPLLARLLLERFVEDFFAEARLVEDFFAVERLVDARFVEPPAARLLEPRFALAPPRDDDEPRFDAPVALRADDFFADDFLAEDFFADDFFADDLRPDDLRAPPVFEEADAPDARVRRRAEPEDLLFDVLPEDFERVAMRELLVEEVCPAGTQELGTQRHQRNDFARNSWLNDV